MEYLEKHIRKKQSIERVKNLGVKVLKKTTETLVTKVEKVKEEDNSFTITIFA